MLRRALSAPVRRTLMLAGGSAAGAALTLPRLTAAPPPPPPPPSTLVRRDILQGSPLQQLVRMLFRCGQLFALLVPVLACSILLRTPLRDAWVTWLVRTLERCGPVGIKWGQWASTRYDLFEDDLCDGLAELTNKAPAHALEWTEEVIETSFGATTTQLFTDFEAVPMASGSIGQVYRAKLRNAHGGFVAGTEVAVKVQHPNLTERLALVRAHCCARRAEHPSAADPIPPSARARAGCPCAHA